MTAFFFKKKIIAYVKSHGISNRFLKINKINCRCLRYNINPLSTNSTKWPNTLKQFA